MKRKAIIFLIAGTTFLSAFGGVASLLATAPDSTEMESRVGIQQNHTEQSPSAIAGNSWGGFDGSDDKPGCKDNPGKDCKSG